MSSITDFSSSQVKGKPRELVLCRARPCVRAKGHLSAHQGTAQPHNQVPPQVRINILCHLCDRFPVTSVGTDTAKVLLRKDPIWRAGLVRITQQPGLQEAHL